MSAQFEITPSHKSPRSARANAASKHIGRWIGKFQIVGELGRGGMGIVFEAQDSVLDRLVAIKLLPRSLSGQHNALQRFLREARSAAKLNDPHVVGIYEADQFNGRYYIVLELVRGSNLQDVIRSGPLDWMTATRVLADACRGMEVAHQAGLVHRDIKPANLMRSCDGTVKLADFGLARPTESVGASMTGSGNVLGTPQFMSPEQCRSELADIRSDVYAMGATYYALLTGRAPFSGEAPLLLMNAHLWDPIPDPRELSPLIPAACSAVVRRAMAKDPDDRYQTAGQLLADLEAVLQPAGKATQKHVSRVSRMNPKSIIQAISLAGLFVALWLVDWSSLGESARTRSIQQPAGVAMATNVMYSGQQLTVPASILPDLHLPGGTFKLPGMRRDERNRDANFQRWVMDYLDISHVCLANSGEFLVVLTNDAPSADTTQGQGHVHVWSRDGKILLDAALTGRATSAAISSDSRRLAVGAMNGEGVHLWNTTTWQREQAAELSESGDVDAVALSHDGRWLAYTTRTGENDGSWVLWDLTEQQQKQLSKVVNSGRLQAIAFAPEGELLIRTGSQDGTMRLFSGLSGEQKPKQNRTGAAVAAMTFSPDQSLVAAGTGRYFGIWSCLENRREHAFASQTGDVNCIAFSPTGSEVCWAAGSSVQCVDVKSGHSVATLHDVGSHVISLACLPDAKGILTACGDGKLVLWWMSRESEVGDR